MSIPRYLTPLIALPVLFADDIPGKLFDAPGATIHYERVGPAEGTPLLLVNGGPGFDHTYLHIAAAWDSIAKNRPVIFYDQRGNGKSGPLKPGQSCTLADQIEDLEALRAQIGSDKIDLLGHSWGGFLVMAYAARHPEHIQHLIIVDSAAPKWSDTVFLFRNIFPEGTAREDALAFAAAMGDKSAADASTHEYLSMLFYSEEHRDYFLKRMSPDASNRTVNQMINRDVARFDLNPELPKFRFPTLVITGRYDINVAPIVAYKIHRAMPGSRFAVFERSGHMPFYEQPDEFVKLLEGFLSNR